ncbi:MAG TPA: DUF5683 domain-containing protein [Longimicrobiales bacterium]|nr:DUF5683 domain-containing protein [Longimicrobiales bacterium]
MNRRTLTPRRDAVALLFAALTLGGAATAAAQEADHQGRRSPPLALALSLVLPGAGQVYNGDYLKGTVMFVGTAAVISASMLSLSDAFGLDDDTSGTGTHVLGAVGVGLILWSWIDAPLSARAINRRLEAGGSTVALGPRVQVAKRGGGVDLTLLGIGF